MDSIRERTLLCSGDSLGSSGQAVSCTICVRVEAVRKSRARAPRVSLTDEIVRDVLQQAASGSFDGRTVDHWDAEANRLVLRAREQAVGFYYRRRDVTVRLGDAESVQLWDARIRAEFVHEILH